LLAACGDEEAGETIDLGGGIALVRQTPIDRPRRGPGPSDRPFDARQLALSDDDRPHTDRRTAALVVELTDLIGLPPSPWVDSDERRYDIHAAIAQLEGRGFDAEALIRYGIGHMLPMSIAAYVLLPIMMED